MIFNRLRNCLTKYKEERALITQTFLPWAETTPPIFPVNMQILGGLIRYRAGKKPSPRPQLSCRRLWRPRARGAVLWGGQAGRAAVGHLCLGLLLRSAESGDLGFVTSALQEIAPLCCIFWCWFIEATGQAGQSRTDAEPASSAVPGPRLRSCVTKRDGLAPADSLKCHIAVGDE